MKRKKIEKAIEKAEQKIDDPYVIYKKGASLTDTLHKLSDQDRKYMKELLAETLDQLFNKKKHKKE